MKFLNALLISAVLIASSCSKDDPDPNGNTDECITRWNQIMGAEGALTWDPGKINIKLTDPKADQYGIDRASTEVYYQREDEKRGAGYQAGDDRPDRASQFNFTDLDLIIDWKDLQLQDSVYVNIGLAGTIVKSKYNRKASEIHAQIIGLLLFHNRAELHMPFTEIKVIPLPAFPKDGQVVFKRRLSEPTTTKDIAGTIVLKTAGVTDSLSHYSAGMLDLPIIGMYFTKDAPGVSSLSITKCEFKQVKAPAVTPQDAASYSDSFQCNSTTKWDY